jgi:hypothetical protein
MELSIYNFQLDHNNFLSDQDGEHQNFSASQDTNMALASDIQLGAKRQRSRNNPPKRNNESDRKINVL